MKRASIIIALFSVSLLVLAFSGRSASEETVTIKVTAPQPTEFDMYQEGIKIARGLKTPYQFNSSKANDRFIFKSQDQKTELKVTLDKGNGVVLMGQWPIVVLLIEKGTVTTFGID